MLAEGSCCILFRAIKSRCYALPEPWEKAAQSFRARRNMQANKNTKSHQSQQELLCAQEYLASWLLFN